MSNYLQISKMTALCEVVTDAQSTDQAEGKRPMERTKERGITETVCRYNFCSQALFIILFGL